MMNHKRFGLRKGRRLATALISCLVLGSITVFGIAASGSWTGHTYLAYKTFPAEEKILKDVGFIPKYTEVLPGGFKFDIGGFGSNTLTGGKGEVINESKEVSFGYSNGQEKSSLTLSVEQIDEAFLRHEGTKQISNSDGVNFNYYEQTYKFVPENYELTEADRKAQEEGTLAISIGAPEVSVEQVQGLSWYEEGLAYMLMGNDHNFSVEQMMEMAEVIRQQD
ncbi:MAG: hypothetical protein RSB66_08415 [Clostridium sp.]